MWSGGLARDGLGAAGLRVQVAAQHARPRRPAAAIVGSGGSLSGGSGHDFVGRRDNGIGCAGWLRARLLSSMSVLEGSLGECHGDGDAGGQSFQF